MATFSQRWEASAQFAVELLRMRVKLGVFELDADAICDDAALLTEALEKRLEHYDRDLRNEKA